MQVLRGKKIRLVERVMKCNQQIKKGEKRNFARPGRGADLKKKRAASKEKRKGLSRLTRLRGGSNTLLAVGETNESAAKPHGKEFPERERDWGKRGRGPKVGGEPVQKKLAYCGGRRAANRT